MFTYDDHFYHTQKAGSRNSALAVVPIVLDILPINSVCDVGCGVGTWLSTFAESGISDFLGLDGSYVRQADLQINSSHFLATDLELPLTLDRSFDLAVSLEVAEHLSQSRAESFVADLTRIAPVVLFSAAIPGQGGTNHINEQWPSWWAKLFSQHNFGVCDTIRHHIWERKDVMPWYRQNILLFARRDIIDSNPNLIEVHGSPIDVVHPDLYLSRIPSHDRNLLARHLWWAINRDVRWWWSHKVMQSRA